MTDIQNRNDIEILVRAFYTRVSKDDVIGHFFKDTDFDAHLPKMYNFWESILFGTGKFSGNSKHKNHERTLRPLGGSMDRNGGIFI